MKHVSFRTCDLKQYNILVPAGENLVTYSIYCCNFSYRSNSVPNENVFFVRVLFSMNRNILQIVLEYLPVYLVKYWHKWVQEKDNQRSIRVEFLLQYSKILSNFVGALLFCNSCKKKVESTSFCSFFKRAKIFHSWLFHWLQIFFKGTWLKDMTDTIWNYEYF